MMDSNTQIEAVVREVKTHEFKGKPAKIIVLSQHFPTTIDDLWDAVTDIERLPRWFAPVKGDLKRNGHFEVENNASGTLTSCEAPLSFNATWEFGEAMSWIEVRLSEVDSGHTRLELAHIAYPDEHWDQFGPGAGGVGWDLSFLGLATHLATGENIHQTQLDWGESPAAVDFIIQSSKAWIEADVAGGEVEAAAQFRGENTINFYTGAE